MSCMVAQKPAIARCYATEADYKSKPVARQLCEYSLEWAIDKTASANRAGVARGDK